MVDSDGEPRDNRSRIVYLLQSETQINLQTLTSRLYYGKGG